MRTGGVMTEVLYLSERGVADLVRQKYGFQSVQFGHDEEFLHDEPEGVVVIGNDGDEIDDDHRLLDLFHLSIEYAERLGFEFRGWRLFTIYEGFGVALLVRRK